MGKSLFTANAIAAGDHDAIRFECIPTGNCMPSSPTAQSLRDLGLHINRAPSAVGIVSAHEVIPMLRQYRAEREETGGGMTVKKIARRVLERSVYQGSHAAISLPVESVTTKEGVQGDIVKVTLVLDDSQGHLAARRYFALEALHNILGGAVTAEEVEDYTYDMTIGLVMDKQTGPFNEDVQEMLNPGYLHLRPMDSWPRYEDLDKAFDTTAQHSTAPVC